MALPKPTYQGQKITAPSFIDTQRAIAGMHKSIEDWRAREEAGQAAYEKNKAGELLTKALGVYEDTQPVTETKIIGADNMKEVEAQKKKQEEVIKKNEAILAENQAEKEKWEKRDKAIIDAWMKQGATRDEAIQKAAAARIYTPKLGNGLKGVGELSLRKEEKPLLEVPKIDELKNVKTKTIVKDTLTEKERDNRAKQVILEDESISGAAKLELMPLFTQYKEAIHGKKPTIEEKKYAAQLLEKTTKKEDEKKSLQALQKKYPKLLKDVDTLEAAKFIVKQDAQKKKFSDLYKKEGKAQIKEAVDALDLGWSDTSSAIKNLESVVGQEIVVGTDKHGNPKTKKITPQMVIEALPTMGDTLGPKHFLGGFFSDKDILEDVEAIKSKIKSDYKSRLLK